MDCSILIRIVNCDDWNVLFGLFLSGTFSGVVVIDMSVPFGMLDLWTGTLGMARD